MSDELKEAKERSGETGAIFFGKRDVDSMTVEEAKEEYERIMEDPYFWDPPASTPVKTRERQMDYVSAVFKKANPQLGLLEKSLEGVPPSRRELAMELIKEGVTPEKLDQEKIDHYEREIEERVQRLKVELGGEEKADRAISIARKVLHKNWTDKELYMLDDLGISTNPRFIRLLNEVAEMINEAEAKHSPNVPEFEEEKEEGRTKKGYGWFD